MITIRFRRESVCMGDDAGNGEYIIELQDNATLGELLYLILHGWGDRDWPIPYTGADSTWIIHSNIGVLARIYTDSDGEWHISDYYCDKETPLQDLGITWTFGGRD